MRDATYKRQFNLNLPEQIVEAMGGGRAMRASSQEVPRKVWQPRRGRRAKDES
jgi:hypothetical protein